MSNGIRIKKTVILNGVVTEYTLSGKDRPVVILLNGYRMPLSSWDELYPEIQRYGRILAYNRYGIGKTSKASYPQTGKEVIKSLENILKALNLSPPYVLVAHSLGGVFANLYARLKPTEISAVVFVEASHPEEKKRQENYRPPLIIRSINHVLKAIDIYFDKYQHSEDECLAETLRQIEVAGNFPEIPITVVTGGKKMPLVPEASFGIHLQCQKELTTLSPLSVQLFAKKSGHFPQITEPNLVINAIRETVVRSGENG